MIKGGALRENAKPRKVGGPVSLMLRSRRSLGLRAFINVRDLIVSRGKFISWVGRSRSRTTLTRPGSVPDMEPACY
jgi:hypothetical protein